MAEIVANKPITKTARQDPAQVERERIRKEAMLMLALKTPQGISKLAAALMMPVRKHLDYVPIGRKLFVVENIPEGQIAYYDSDIEEFYGSKVGPNGTSRMIVCKALRTQVDWFVIVTKPKVPFPELRVRKYKVVDRVKERLKQGLGLREDLLIFSLLHTAAVATGGNSEVSIGSALTKDSIALALNQIERHRLVVQNIVMNTYSLSGIRRWDRDQVDEVARIEIRETGYIGNLFGCNFFFTTLIESSGGFTYVYLTAPPQFVGWMPMWADGEVVPGDRPDDLLVGFVGWEMLGMLVHNNWGVSRIKHVSPGTFT